MRTSKLLTLLAVTLMLMACGTNQSNDTHRASANGGASGQAASLEVPEGSVAGTVVETMDAGGYTYVQLDTGSEKIWAAGPPTKVEVGQELYVATNMAMPNFHSETLDRTFDSIYFVTAFGGAEGGSAMGGMPAGHPDIGQGMPEGHPQSTPGAEVDTSGIEATDYTIARIFSEKAELGGKKVQVRGKVVKSNVGIMNRNWLHIQDGTGVDGSDDLTVTTTATAKVGDTVLVEGVVTLDKDFGAGYKYDVIIEEATVTVE